MNILIFGDSITQGFNDDIGGGWVNRLKSYVESTYDGIKVYNFGISGNTAVDLLNRIESELNKNLNPDIIMFSIGLNDSQYFHETKKYRFTTDEFKNNLDKLYKTALAYTPKIIFLGLTNMDESKLDPIPWAKEKKSYYASARVDFDKVIQDFTNEHNLQYISMENVISLEDLPDGIHPNADGHENIFQAVKNGLVIR